MIPSQRAREESLAGVPTAPPRGALTDREESAAVLPGGDDDLLKGRYRLITLIGHGSFGEVWEAFDTELERDVAIKILVPLSGATPAEVQADRDRFLREAQLTSRFYGRDHIVLVLDSGAHDGQLFLVMQLLRGRNLESLLRTEGPLDPERGVAIIRQVGHALDRAHDEGLVHRDVKPANVFVEEGDVVTLLDFGMVGAIDQGRLAQITLTGQVPGTLAYMAPERFPGKDGTPPKASSSPEGDIYSLACILYKILTGQSPFHGDMWQLRNAHQEGARPSLAEGALREFDPVVRSGLAIEPADRPASGSALADEADDAVAARRARLDAEAEQAAEAEREAAVRAAREAEAVAAERARRAEEAAAWKAAEEARAAAEEAEAEAERRRRRRAEHRARLTGPVLVGGASTGILGTAAVLATGASPVTSGIVIACAWAGGAGLGWLRGTRGP